MIVDHTVQSILDEALSGHEMTREQALELLDVVDDSPEAYAIFSAANQLTRRQFHNMGEVHAQTGMNHAPCPKKCKA